MPRREPKRPLEAVTAAARGLFLVLLAFVSPAFAKKASSPPPSAEDAIAAPAPLRGASADEPSSAELQLEVTVNSTPTKKIEAFVDLGALVDQRLLAMEDEQLTRLTGVAGPDLLLAMGDVPDLPWVDGVKYLGRDARARELLLPTAVEPSLPLELVHRAFALEFSDAARIAIIDDPPLVVPVGAARELARAEINRWLAGVS